MDKTVRIDSYLAGLGYASRRKIEDFLKDNTVQVNKTRIKETGFRLNPQKDTVNINGKPVIKPKLVYYALNKPNNIISSASDEHGRKTVTSLVPSKERLYPVGRLDAESAGLIFLTNDGELANKLTHPRYHVSKTYEVLIQGGILQNHLTKLRDGVRLKDGMTAPAEVTILKHIQDKTLIQIILFEGRNRQIRRMCGALGLNLVHLKRTKIGSVELGDLKPGQYRELTSEEVASLKALPV